MGVRRHVFRSFRNMTHLRRGCRSCELVRDAEAERGEAVLQNIMSRDWMVSGIGGIGRCIEELFVLLDEVEESLVRAVASMGRGSRIDVDDEVRGMNEDAMDLCGLTERLREHSGEAARERAEGS